MKKSIALLLTLLLCVPALAGCGNKAASARQDYAVEYFNITEKEYERNREYYDELLRQEEGAENLFSNAEPINSQSQSSSFDSSSPVEDGTWNDGGDDWREFYSLHDLDYLKYMLGQKDENNKEINKIIAIKKGDRFYTVPTFNLDQYDIKSHDSFGMMEKIPEVECYIGKQTDYAWAWPDLSLSGGDSLVVFSTGSSPNEDLYSSDEQLTTCFPLAFSVDGYDSGFNRVLFLYGRQYTNEQGQEESFPSGDELEIDGISLVESPRNVEIFHYDDSASGRYYFAYVVGGQSGETTTVGYYDGTIYKTVDLICNCVCFNAKDHLELSDPQPTHDGYAILLDKNTGSVPSGQYILEGFPINIIN